MPNKSPSKIQSIPPELSGPVRKVIFLDRDGVISDNSTYYYLTRVEEFTLNPGVLEALSELKERGYEFIVITNQGGISLGKNSAENVERIHGHMKDLFQRKGIKLRLVQIELELNGLAARETHLLRKVDRHKRAVF